MRLLSNLAAFNKLDERVVDIISKVFKMDAKEICEKWGITYFNQKNIMKNNQKELKRQLTLLKNQNSEYKKTRRISNWH